MIFNQKDRTNVDIVEQSFVKYKLAHPEEDDFLVEYYETPAEYAYPMLPLSSQMSNEEVIKARELAPWGYSFDLSRGFSTDAIDHNRDEYFVAPAGRNDILLRLSMLNYLFDQFKIDGRWIDIATNCGIIPLLLAKGRNLEVVASDFAEVNIQKAQFLKSISGNLNCSFHTDDAFNHLRNVPEGGAQLVSALGIFYHLSNPIELLELLYKASAKYVLIDTIIHNFGFSGWIQTISRHVKHPELAHANDTRKILELHPTYRGMIDALFQVGFKSVVEVVPGSAILKQFPDTIYHTRNRRMLLAAK